MWADHSIGTGEEAGVKLLQGALPRISPLSRVPLFRKCAKTLSLVMCLACLRFSLLFSQRVLVLSSAGQSSKMCVSRGALSRRKLLNAVNSYGCKVCFCKKTGGAQPAKSREFLRQSPGMINMPLVQNFFLRMADGGFSGLASGALR